ncbi:hypothetical protein M3Y98_00707600 [Aphelenchoides besseyi]|nr:hypothetical protein M3Y98_00707600 [Aphelenchoides besseyi]
MKWNPKCPRDERHKMQMRMARRAQDLPTWRCTTKRCRKEMGIRNYSWFEGGRVHPKEVFLFSYFWAHDLASVDLVKREMRRSDGSTWNSHTITDHRNYFRELCVNWQLKQDVQIGGPGHTVQIDETCISRRKYNRGRLQKENVWLFGGVDTVDRTFFLKRVDCRSADTLLPIIQKHVKAGSTIMSDQWRAYGGICRLPEGYTHLKVNHSVHFVNPETGTHTQQIESFWRDVKQRQKRELGTATQFYDDYVAEFLWKRTFAGADIFFHLWSEIALQWPLSTGQPDEREIGDDEDNDNGGDAVERDIRLREDVIDLN